MLEYNDTSNVDLPHSLQDLDIITLIDDFESSSSPATMKATTKLIKQRLCEVHALINESINHDSILQPLYASSLNVKQSFTPQSGNGLFTTTFIPAGVNICNMTGDIETHSTQMSSLSRSYLLFLGKCVHFNNAEIYINTSSTRHQTVKARYINDSIYASLQNVKFKPNPNNLSCEVWTIRDIEEGEEIYVDYVDGYWGTAGSGSGSGGSCFSLIEWEMEMEGVRRGRLGLVGGEMVEILEIFGEEV